MKTYRLDPLLEIEWRVRMDAAVQHLYTITGLEPPSSSNSITPLGQIFESLPGIVTVSEVPDLTYARAAQFLRDEIGHDASVPDHAEQRLDGLLYAWFDMDILYAYILVCAGGLVERRRFTVAHELGHLILHVLLPKEDIARPGLFVEGFIDKEKGTAETGDEAREADSDDNTFAHAEAFTDEGVRVSLPPIEVMEMEADAFAATLLMPENLCRSLAAAHKDNIGDRRAVLIRRLAVDLLVSKAAMQRRLETLNLGS
ncbi:MAG: ImmA/IrrE family metallo-endopeptidase [Rhodothermales bacterium]